MEGRGREGDDGGITEGQGNLREGRMEGGGWEAIVFQNHGKLRFSRLSQQEEEEENDLKEQVLNSCLSTEKVSCCMYVCKGQEFGQCCSRNEALTSYNGHSRT